MNKPNLDPFGDRYWWFDKETVDALRAKLDAGAQRLEVRIDHNQFMTLRVIPLGEVAAQEGGDLNKSNVCPPICP